MPSIRIVTRQGLMPLRADQFQPFQPIRQTQPVPGSFADRALRILRNHKRPMTSRELLNACGCNVEHDNVIDRLAIWIQRGLIRAVLAERNGRMYRAFEAVIHTNTTRKAA